MTNEPERDAKADEATTRRHRYSSKCTPEMLFEQEEISFHWLAEAQRLSAAHSSTLAALRGLVEAVEVRQMHTARACDPYAPKPPNESHEAANNLHAALAAARAILNPTPEAGR